MMPKQYKTSFLNISTRAVKRQEILLYLIVNLWWPVRSYLMFKSTAKFIILNYTMSK